MVSLPEGLEIVIVEAPLAICDNGTCLHLDIILRPVRPENPGFSDINTLEECLFDTKYRNSKQYIPSTVQSVDIEDTCFRGPLSAQSLRPLCPEMPPTNEDLPVLCQPGFPSEIISNPDYDFVPAFQIHFANGARFKLPISPLVARVPFFQRYLDRPPSEQLLDQNITLPHEAPDAFLLFCQWLLGGISAETFASISTERWFSFIVIVDDYKLHTLAREAMVAMITSLAFSPPGAVMLGEVARQFARCYRRARSHGIRFVAVHFIAVSLKHLRRNSILRDPRLAEPRFTDDYFRWQPMTDIRPKNDLVTDMDTAKGDLLQHLLPLLFRVKRLSDVIIDTMYLGNSQDAEEEIRHEIRTYLEIEDD